MILLAIIVAPFSQSLRLDFWYYGELAVSSMTTGLAIVATLHLLAVISLSWGWEAIPLTLTHLLPDQSLLTGVLWMGFTHVRAVHDAIATDVETTRLELGCGPLALAGHGLVPVLCNGLPESIRSATDVMHQINQFGMNQLHSMLIEVQLGKLRKLFDRGQLASFLGKWTCDSMLTTQERSVRRMEVSLTMHATRTATTNLQRPILLLNRDWHRLRLFIGRPQQCGVR